MNAHADFDKMAAAAERHQRALKHLSTDEPDTPEGEAQFNRRIKDMSVDEWSYEFSARLEAKWELGADAREVRLAGMRSITSSGSHNDRDGIDYHAAGCSRDSNGMRIL